MRKTKSKLVESDLLRIYLKEIAQYPLLDRSEEGLYLGFIDQYLNENKDVFIVENALLAPINGEIVTKAIKKFRYQFIGVRGIEKPESPEGLTETERRLAGIYLDEKFQEKKNTEVFGYLNLLKKQKEF